MRTGQLPFDHKIAACEQAYREAGLPIVFHIAGGTADPALDAALVARGYVSADESSVLLADLARFSEPLEGAVILEADLSSAWLDGLAAFNRLTPVRVAAHRAIVAATRHPTMFGSIRDAGAIAAVAAAVLQDRFVYFNAVATDPAKRRRGLSRRIMVALLAWAKQQGAGYAYLPVDTVNRAALAMYDGLGFTTELYRYHYRTRVGD
ncbi:MAG: GNAT family N-acetyltransferase [Proteobacteria bacterium]|nr:GNAT family N-acetyltransferase [Pseudomonadota bacterium]